VVWVCCGWLSYVWWNEKMNTIGISNYPHLQGGKETEEDYSVATTFGDIKIIVFNKIPKRQYGFIESWIEEIIEHESIHIILYEIKEVKAGKSLDNFFPLLSDLWSFMRNPQKFYRDWKKRTTKSNGEEGINT